MPTIEDQLNPEIVEQLRSVIRIPANPQNQFTASPEWRRRNKNGKSGSYGVVGPESDRFAVDLRKRPTPDSAPEPD